MTLEKEFTIERFFEMSKEIRDLKNQIEGKTLQLEKQE